MSEETHYATLGVSETATQAEIKIAYRKLLKKIHPDTVSTLSPTLRHEAENATKAINEAYAVLSNSVRRQLYNQELSAYRRVLLNAASGARREQTPAESMAEPLCFKCGQPLDAAGYCMKCDVSYVRIRKRHRSKPGPLLLWAKAHPWIASGYLLVALMILLALIIAIVSAVRGTNPVDMVWTSGRPA